MEVKKPLSSGSVPLHGKCSPLRSSHRDMIRDLEHRLYRIYLVRNIGHLRLKSMRISSCFFSSLEKIRISPISVFKNLLRTTSPNEPVPPDKVLSVNNPILKSPMFPQVYLAYFVLPFGLFFFRGNMPLRKIASIIIFVLERNPGIKAGAIIVVITCAISEAAAAPDAPKGGINNKLSKTLETAAEP